MEKDTRNSLPEDTGISLHLRSREVSEVMGDIPGWIGSVGAFLIYFLFTASMLLVLNIRCIEKIPAKVTLGGGLQSWVRVVITGEEYEKIKAGKTARLDLGEVDKGLKALGYVSFSIEEAKLEGDSYVMELPFKRQDYVPYVPPGEVFDCRVVSEMAVFQKVLGWLSF